MVEKNYFLYILIQMFTSILARVILSYFGHSHKKYACLAKIETKLKNMAKTYAVLLFWPVILLI